VRVSTEHRAWLVDLDGTLYHRRPVQLAMAFELLVSGPGAIATLRAFRRQHEQLRAAALIAEGEESPYARQLSLTAATLKLEPTVVEARVAHWMLERPGKWLRLFRRRTLLDRIRQFRQSGGRTALVSDYPARLKLEALAAHDLFDVIIANGETPGLTQLKPSPDAFLMAARELGVLASECLVLGDREDADGLAARAAGMSFELVR